MYKRKLAIRCLIALLFLYLLYIFAKTFPRADKFVWKDIEKNQIFHCNPDDYVVKRGDGSQIHQLPLLGDLEWPTDRFSHTPVPDEIAKQEPFEPRMSRAQFATQQKLLVKFASIMRKRNLESEWFLDSGSVIGSIRHHNMIPYDDDIDVGVKEEYRQIIRQEMNETDGEYLLANMGNFDKIYMKLIDPPNSTLDLIGSRKVRNYPFGWPCLDIFYFTTSFNTIHFKFHGRKENLTETFPLVYRPFYNNWYPAPRRPIAYCRRTFSDFIYCRHGGYSHAKEYVIKHVMKNCSSLRSRYPFVQRRPLSNSNKFKDGDNLQCIVEDLVIEFKNKTSKCIQTVVTAVSAMEAFELQYT